MNGTMQQIVSACVPVLCLLITAGGAYAVALLRRETAKLQKEIDNETANKYMDMAVDAVEQAVASTAQTFVDALKSSGGFTKEKQLEAFQKSRDKALEILGDTVQFAGGPHYTSSNAASSSSRPKAGPAKVTAISKGAKHPYHVVHTNRQSSVYGWVDADKVSK